jgi:hypothetical protein
LADFFEFPAIAGDFGEPVKIARPVAFALFIGRKPIISEHDEAEFAEALRAIKHKPRKRTDPRFRLYRRLMARGWDALMEWTVSVGTGRRIAQSIFDPVSPPRKALTNVLKPAVKASIVRDKPDRALRMCALPGF